MFSGIIFIIASGIIAFTFLLTYIMFAPDFRSAWIYIPVLTCAMVFFNFVSFLGSVYVVSKKTVWSFITSLAGALLNVVLNFLLIPIIGAMGAALATLASFVLVFILRVITASRITSFNMHLPKLVLNGIILGVQCFVIIKQIPFWIVAEIICLAVMIAVNGVPYFRLALDFLKSRNKKKS